MQPNNPTPIERALARLEGIEEQVVAMSDAPWREGIPGNLRVYAADGNGAESGPVVHGLSCEKARANMTGVVVLRNSSPSMTALIRAQAAYIEASSKFLAQSPQQGDYAIMLLSMRGTGLTEEMEGWVAEYGAARHESIDMLKAANAALLQFAEAGGKP